MGTLIAAGLVATVVAAVVLNPTVLVPALLVMLGGPMVFFGAIGAVDGDPALTIALVAGLVMLAVARPLTRGTRPAPSGLVLRVDGSRRRVR